MPSIGSRWRHHGTTDCDHTERLFHSGVHPHNQEVKIAVRAKTGRSLPFRERECRQLPRPMMEVALRPKDGLKMALQVR